MFNKIIIILFFAICFTIMLFYIDALKNKWLFLIIHSLLLICTFGYNKKLYTQLFSPLSHIKLLYTLSTFCIIFISIIFGFHTDILTKYDQQVTKDKFFWLNHINIIECPSIMLQQFENKNPITFKVEPNIVDDNKILNIMFYDITGSAGLDSQALKIIDELNDENIYQLEKRTFKFSNQIINAALNHTLFNNNINHLLFYTYDGKLNEFQFKNSPEIFTFNNYNHDFRINILNELGNVNKNSNTNINDFINPNIFDKNRIKEYDKIRLFFISDFLDNSNSELNSVNLNYITNSDIISINLINTNGIDNKGKHLYKLIRQKIEEYETYITTNYLKISDFKNTSEMIDNIKMLCQNDNIKYINSDNINFHFPLEIGSSNYAIYCEFCINDNLEHLKFKVKNLDSDANLHYELSKKDSILGTALINSELVIDKISPNDTFKITIPNYSAIEYHRCFLEFFDLKNSKTKILKINPIPTLPFSNLFALIIFYSILISSLCYIFFYIHLKVILNNGDWKIYYYLVSSLSLVPLIYFIWHIHNIYWLLSIKIIIAIVILILTLGHFWKNLNIN